MKNCADFNIIKSGALKNCFRHPGIMGMIGVEVMGEMYFLSFEWSELDKVGMSMMYVHVVIGTCI